MSTPTITNSQMRCGQRFGRWIVVGAPVAHLTRREAMVACRCECGTTRVVSCHRLRSGGSRSCGCLAAELSQQRTSRLEHGHARDGRRSPEYEAWLQMRLRCRPGHSASPLYYDRGIRVCERWKQSFAAFLADMGPRPGRGCSIDRIDNDGPYAPGNCRWATLTEQSNNRRCNWRITWRGETRTVGEWARHFSVPYGRFAQRLRLGWSMERAASTPRRGTLA